MACAFVQSKRRKLGLAEALRVVRVHAPAQRAAPLAAELLAEVGALHASAAGATVTRPPSETFYGGYAGVFTDPDGHAWIAYNPGFALTEDGRLTIPDFSP